MNARTTLFGTFEPGDGWLFRMPVGWKYALMLGIALPPLFIWEWWATLAALVLAVGALLSSGIGARRALALGWYLWALLAAMALYQAASTLFEAAFVSPGNVLAAVLASRMLTLTTSTPDLMDALSTALRPIRLVGGNPDSVSLVIALMLRSIPYLAGSLQDARDAARARGSERNPVLLLSPAVVGSVAYAQRTGEALHARGLPGDRPDDRPRINAGRASS
ncbi:biotin transport system permease protein [Tessaracoccus bendigoensis DSM 12906]|uniref:Biotin transport system permease protein n=1 Tax=Tessaracoccus bendigoensis DSM 12906 TaxID=1123357 RepID=A0A1M6LEG8_9ACTN|nr:energy-coupling factor transporter transmembrane component T [Tessaracoccus bendigoensis]SHJ69566.1 biotin transport system permease protein [Tessaracoccus bendigoensis DSM 12906]